MKKKIEIYKSVTVLDKEFEIELPEQPIYYRNSFYREYFALFPQFANWPDDDGSIWKYDFIKIIDEIGDGCIKYGVIPVSEFANICNIKKKTLTNMMLLITLLIILEMNESQRSDLKKCLNAW